MSIAAARPGIHIGKANNNRSLLKNKAFLDPQINRSEAPRSFSDLTPCCPAAP